MVMNLNNFTSEYKREWKRILEKDRTINVDDIDLILESYLIDFKRVDDSIYVTNLYTQNSREFLSDVGNNHLTSTYIKRHNKNQFEALLKEALSTEAITYEKYAKHKRIIKKFTEIEVYNKEHGNDIEHLKDNLHFDIVDENCLQVKVTIVNEEDRNDTITLKENFVFGKFIKNNDKYTSYVRFIYHFLTNKELQKELFKIKDVINETDEFEIGININGIYNYYTNLNNQGIKVKIPISVIYKEKFHNIYFIYKNGEVFKKYYEIENGNKFIYKEYQTIKELLD